MVDCAALTGGVFCCRALDFIEGVSSSANKAGVFASPTATTYWAYHLTRTGFLAVQGLSGANKLSAASVHFC